MPFPGQQLMIGVRRCVPKHEAKLSVNFLITIFKGSSSQDTSHGMMISGVDQGVPARSAPLIEYWGLPLKLHANISIQFPGCSKEAIQKSQSIVHCNARKKNYISPLAKEKES